MKNILILGEGGYIAEKLKAWLASFPEHYVVKIISTYDNVWRNEPFVGYDVVINCAGVAHIKNATESMKTLFYSVNRDLVIELGKYAKESGVPYFIHFSSMNVYGDFCGHLEDRRAENPTSFYGDSKLQGDVGLKSLEDDSFKVAYVRPPFVYGRGCKGNYNTISSISKMTPVFPAYKNKKSMIYIDNLCEFIRMCIEEKLHGVLTPQNKELVSTSDLLRAIRLAHGRNTWCTRTLNWLIPVAAKISNLAKKAFGNDFYDLQFSDYFNWKYCVVDFEASIKATETGNKA